MQENDFIYQSLTDEMIFTNYSVDRKMKLSALREVEWKNH